MIDLTPFCGPWHSQRAPWSTGGFSYATDGSLIVRVPDPDQRFADGHGPDVTRLTFAPADGAAFVSLAHLSFSEHEKCPLCGGDGKNRQCPECNGMGVLTFTSPSLSDYEVECALCQGAHKLDKCPYCDGTGLMESRARVRIHGIGFAAGLLFKIKTLPDCEIAPAPEGGPAYFRFTDGDGLLMPLTKEKKP